YNRRDLTDMYVTRDYFVVSAYGDGETPLWNPYTMAGHPIYADGVTRTLSPFLLFYKFFDVPLGYSLARITELILAAVFMYIFLVRIGVSAASALLGSLVFEFSSHSMLHLTGLGWWGGLMWLPLIILFVDRALERRSYAQAAIAGVLLAAQFFCGYLPNQIYYVGAVVLYYLFFALVKRRGPVSYPMKRSLALMAITLLVGLALAATQWVPMLELLRYSNRKIVGAELSYIYLPPWYGLTLIFPNLFGAAYDTRTLTLFTALNVSHDHILYLGIGALLPLAFSLYSLRRQRAEGRKQKAQGSEQADENRLPSANRLLPSDSRVAFFALLAAISLLIMMAAPVYVPVTRFIPVLQVIRVAVRAGVLFLFAASALVAIGADLLMKAGADELARFARLARKFLFAAISFAAIAIAASYSLRAAGFAVETGDRGRMAFIRKAAAVLSSQFTPPDAGIIIPLAFLSAVVASLWLMSEGRLGRKAFFAGLVALLVVDLFWASGQFNQSFERSRVYPATQITDTLRRLPPGRVLVTPSDLETNRRASSETDKIIAPPNTLLPYRISSVSGKNQQFPKWYRQFASLVEPQPNLSHVVFDQTRSRFFDLLNVRYVMTHAAAPPLDGYELITSAEGVSLYENKNAMPRAFFVDRAIAVRDTEAALETLADPATDTTNAVVIETGAAVVEDDSAGRRTSPRQAAIIEDRRNRVLIETQNETSGLLVLSDNYYPGWRASVDGSPAEIFKANVTMRAVRVPAGRHVVSFVFMPVTFSASLYASLAVAALVLIGLAATLARSHAFRARAGSNNHDIR
ncbi:MAG TPA: YfhO family protein, partial [Blastocatellia bacterium]|nr:YfhO family protein [Blastocatellia bacterium]